MFAINFIRRLQPHKRIMADTEKICYVDARTGAQGLKRKTWIKSFLKDGSMASAED